MELTAGNEGLGFRAVCFQRQGFLGIAKKGVHAIGWQTGLGARDRSWLKYRTWEFA